MARAMQRVENLWVGVQSGIMDQLIGAAGVAGHALLIDCRDLSLRPVPLPRRRRRRRARHRHPPHAGRQRLRRPARRLRAASPPRSACGPARRRRGGARGRHRAPRPVDLRRARHVVGENARTLEAADALAAATSPLRRLMDASHESLRDDFEVSSPALDAIVAAARAAPGCLGARMTGAGFGGCAVALVTEADVSTPSSRRPSTATGAPPVARARVPEPRRGRRGAGAVPLTRA
jgi:galactokinase